VHRRTCLVFNAWNFIIFPVPFSYFQLRNFVGLGRYISVSVHRNIFSDDLRIDTPTRISILPFFFKNENDKNICFQPNVKVIVWWKNSGKAWLRLCETSDCSLSPCIWRKRGSELWTKFVFIFKFEGLNPFDSLFTIAKSITIYMVSWYVSDRLRAVSFQPYNFVMIFLQKFKSLSVILKINLIRSLWVGWFFG
jgi:hypothetical protein